MQRRRILGGLLLLLALVVLLANVKSAGAVTITPNPPVAGQPITFSGSSADVGGSIFSGFGCTGSFVASVSTGGPGPYSFTLTGGLPAGSYSVEIIDDLTPPTGCVDFTVNKASPTVSVNCLASTLTIGSTTSCSATLSNGYLITGMVSWSQTGGTGTATFPSGNTCTLSGTSCSITVMGDPGGVTLQASYQGDSNNNLESGTTNLTVNAAPPIPEYPLGIPILAILTIISYGLIRRKIKNTKN